MGIKHLNRFLHKHCSVKAVNHTNIANFKNKTVVVDTSIFMYKFLTSSKTQEGICEKIQQTIQLFKDNQITPIFVFDGKPPKEKTKLMKQRYWKKVLAYRKAEELKQLLLDVPQGSDADDSASAADTEMIENIKKELEVAETDSLRLTKADILAIKELIRSHNYNIIEAEEEADEVCVIQVKLQEADAVISDDMDILVHGCPLTLRNLDIDTGKCVEYHIEPILQELNFNIQQFREIIVLSGTDYSDSTDCDLYKTLKVYTKYKNYLKTNKWQKIGFLDFAIKYTDYVTNKEEIKMAYQKFTYTDSYMAASSHSSSSSSSSSPPPPPPRIILPLLLLLFLLI